MNPLPTTIAFSYNWPADRLMVLVDGPFNPKVFVDAPWAAWTAWRIHLERTDLVWGLCPEGHLLIPMPGDGCVHIPVGQEDEFSAHMMRMLDEAEEVRKQGHRLHLKFVAAYAAHESLAPFPAALGWRQLA